MVITDVNGLVKKIMWP